jgi:hypothetical protein
VSNVVLVVALVAGAASTAFVVWMGNVKEAYGRLALSAMNERAAVAEKEAAIAKKEAADALLALEKLKAPRCLNSDQQMQMVSALRPFASTLFDMASQEADPESLAFLGQLETVLLMAGWTPIDWDNAGKFGFIGHSPTGRSIGRIQMTVTGVLVHVHPDHPQSLYAAAVALCAALVDSQIDARPTAGDIDSSRHDAIHVVIAKKP